MSDTLSHWRQMFDDDAGAPALKRRPLVLDAELDITPMIDVTFLLLIFFLVASTPDVQTALRLAPARFGVGVPSGAAVVISIAATEPGAADIYLADGKIGAPLPRDPNQQAAAVRAAVEEGFRNGRTQVLIKAERGVKHRDVARIAQAASMEGVQLNLGVLEID